MNEAQRATPRKAPLPQLPTFIVRLKIPLNEDFCYNLSCQEINYSSRFKQLALPILTTACHFAQILSRLLEVVRPSTFLRVRTELSISAKPGNLAANKAPTSRNCLNTNVYGEILRKTFPNVKISAVKPAVEKPIADSYWFKKRIQEGTRPVLSRENYPHRRRFCTLSPGRNDRNKFPQAENEFPQVENVQTNMAVGDSSPNFSFGATNQENWWCQMLRRDSAMCTSLMILDVLVTPVCMQN